MKKGVGHLDKVACLIYIKFGILSIHSHSDKQTVSATCANKNTIQLPKMSLTWEKTPGLPGDSDLYSPMWFWDLDSPQSLQIHQKNVC